ncbi:hypothetical protein FDP41_004934 [Naegleria fowleri]|uniref:Uncharacterized protein n=1 Tax=Naegleria fowleri TaxID=5763 RepID=A0A6A5BTL5_NAEFO|nr:uncharacterized protein FDP41_004934 [Naegleria fowleri]KAF0976259.1 hypothetical protein FDP41_004934 [Naegleria fowleri]
MKPTNEYPEEKISDGIYMTDFRRKPSSTTNTTSSTSSNSFIQYTPSTAGSSFSLMEEYENLLATTHYELKELTTKIFHLERSNNEMREIMNESGEDVDLVLAISENEEILVKFRRRVELINERLAHLQCLQCTELKKQPVQDNHNKDSMDDLSDDIDNIML